MNRHDTEKFPSGIRLRVLATAIADAVLKRRLAGENLATADALLDIALETREEPIE